MSVRRAERSDRSKTGVDTCASTSWIRLDTADCVVCSLCAACEKPPSRTIQYTASSCLNVSMAACVLNRKKSHQPECVNIAFFCGIRYPQLRHYPAQTN